MPRTPKIKIASTWYLRFKCLSEPGITIIIIIIIIIIITIVIDTYVWVKGTEEQVPNQNLTNRAEAKYSKYLILNGNISPENMGMDMII